MSISIRALANLIKEVIGYNGILRYDPTIPDGTLLKETNPTKPDGTLLKETNPTKLHNLGWHHKVELREGLERLYKCKHSTNFIFQG